MWQIYKNKIYTIYKNILKRLTVQQILVWKSINKYTMFCAIPAALTVSIYYVIHKESVKNDIVIKVKIFKTRLHLKYVSFCSTNIYMLEGTLDHL